MQAAPRGTDSLTRPTCPACQPTGGPWCAGQGRTDAGEVPGTPAEASGQFLNLGFLVFPEGVTGTAVFQDFVRIKWRNPEKLTRDDKYNSIGYPDQVRLGLFDVTDR